MTIVYCDSCNRCNDGDDETSVYHFRSYPKIGEEGYLIDIDDTDLCLDCFKKYKEKHLNWNISRMNYNGKWTDV